MTALAVSEVESLTRRALRLAQFTVGYNVVEGTIAITAGVGAGLVSLVGFGVDSGIESAVAILVSLRLASRLRHGQADEDKERRTLKFVSIMFFLLAAYVTFSGTRDLVTHATPESSVVGLVLLGTSLVLMPILALAHATVPIMTIVVRKGVGLGYFAMGTRPFDPVVFAAWPSAEFGPTSRNRLGNPATVVPCSASM